MDRFLEGKEVEAADSGTCPQPKTIPSPLQEPSRSIRRGAGEGVTG